MCRLGNVYGPRQNPHGEAGVVAIFSDHLYIGKAPKLFGHGKPTRDYVYVGDVVKALIAASGKSGTYNVATGVETDVATDLARAAEGGRTHEGARRLRGPRLAGARTGRSSPRRAAAQPA